MFGVHLIKKKGGGIKQCPVIASQKESFVSINPRTVKQNWIYFSLLEKDVVLQQYHKRVVKESVKHVRCASRRLCCSGQSECSCKLFL